MDEQKKLKTGRKTLTSNQEEFCKLVVVEGMKPLDAMLKIFPNRASYAVNNQNRLLREMQNNEKIVKRIEELYGEVRNNEVLGDLYNFDKGVRLLNEEIEEAKKKIEEGNFSESLHRIILTSVQELNRMYGFNVIDRNGGSNQNFSVTFVNVNEPEGGVVIEK